MARVRDSNLMTVEGERSADLESPLVDNSPEWLRRLMRGAGLGLMVSGGIAMGLAFFHAFGEEELVFLQMVKEFAASIWSWSQLLVPVMALVDVLLGDYRQQVDSDEQRVRFQTARELNRSHSRRVGQARRQAPMMR